MTENKVESKLINYYKEQTRQGEEGYIDNNNGTVRYDHVGERIQYFEQKIFEEKLKEFKDQLISEKEAREKARKVAWIDWLPFLLQNVKVTEGEEVKFKKADRIGEKNQVLTSCEFSN